jgi:hypothetical protein
LFVVVLLSASVELSVDLALSAAVAFFDFFLVVALEPVWV